MSDYKILSRGQVSMRGVAVMGGFAKDQIVAIFAEYADALAWVEWREYRKAVNDACNAQPLNSEQPK